MCGHVFTFSFSVQLNCTTTSTGTCTGVTRTSNIILLRFLTTLTPFRFISSYTVTNRVDVDHFIERTQNDCITGSIQLKQRAAELPPFSTVELFTH